MSKLVTIYGGSGFVGRYIVRRLAKDGWRVRVAVRRPNEAMHVKPYGAVGQVEPVLANIRDDDSVRAAMQGADAVVNCVGTFDATGKNNFDAVMHVGAGRIARLAAEAAVERMVHISAIGADQPDASLYAEAKAAGEKVVHEHMPGAMILRPSIVFGPEDLFFNRFASMAQLSPVIPLFGASTRFQPVYVDDLAAAACLGVEGRAEGGVYELGGPDVRSFRELMADMLPIIRRRRLVLGLPFWAGRVTATMGAVAQFLSLGIIKAPITSDQLRSLRVDNIVGDTVKSFAELGIEPQSMEAILPDYLWRFRPSGQYADINQSAENLRGGDQV